MLSKAQLIEEERALVGGDGEVEPGRPGDPVEPAAIGCRHQPAQDLGSRLPIGIDQHVEAQSRSRVAKRGQLRRRQRCARQHEGRDVAAGGHEHMPPRIDGAGIDHRANRERDHAARLVDVTGVVPSAHREHAAIGEPARERAPALERIQAVLGKRERPGAGGGPGVDHAHLDQIERSIRRRKPRPRIVDVQRQARHRAQVRERRVKRIAQVQVDEDAIQFDAGDRLDAEQMRRQHIATAADADHRRALDTRQVIGQVDEVVFEEVDRFSGAVEVRHGGAGGAVDVEIRLLHAPTVRHLR